MTAALLILAVLCACFGAWKGKRSAIALLASTALTCLFVWAEVPFNIGLWLLIDVAVIATVASRPLGVAEVAILALFIPAWVLYAEPDAFANEATTLIVSAQLLLASPWRWAWRKVRRLPIDPDEMPELMRVSHA